MKLLLLITTFALTGAAKLDRTYLPPPSATLSGGSPGAILAPDETSSPFSDQTINATADYGTDSANRSKEAEYSFLQTPDQPSLQNLENKNDKNPDFSVKSNDILFPQNGKVASELSGVIYPPELISNNKNGLQTNNIYFPSQSNIKTPDFNNSLSASDNSEEHILKDYVLDGVKSSESVKENTHQSYKNFEQKDNGLLTSKLGSISIENANNQYVQSRVSFDGNSKIIHQKSEITPNGYYYAYETENGIKVNEMGKTFDGTQAIGEYSYVGDDGVEYIITYTADERGFQPKGKHLPTSPPIPEAILRSLKKNAEDEALGLTDDGFYHEERYQYKDNGNRFQPSYQQYNVGKFNKESIPMQKNTQFQEPIFSSSSSDAFDNFKNNNDYDMKSYAIDRDIVTEGNHMYNFPKITPEKIISNLEGDMSEDIIASKQKNNPIVFDLSKNNLTKEYISSNIYENQESTGELNRYTLNNKVDIIFDSINKTQPNYDIQRDYTDYSGKNINPDDVSLFSRTADTDNNNYFPNDSKFKHLSPTYQIENSPSYNSNIDSNITIFSDQGYYYEQPKLPISSFVSSQVPKEDSFRNLNVLISKPEQFIDSSKKFESSNHITQDLRLNIDSIKQNRNTNNDNINKNIVNEFSTNGFTSLNYETPNFIEPNQNKVNEPIVTDNIKIENISFPKLGVSLNKLKYEKQSNFYDNAQSDGQNDIMKVKDKNMFSDRQGSNINYFDKQVNPAKNENEQNNPLTMTVENASSKDNSENIATTISPVVFNKMDEQDVEKGLNKRVMQNPLENTGKQNYNTFEKKLQSETLANQPFEGYFYNAPNDYTSTSLRIKDDAFDKIARPVKLEQIHPISDIDETVIDDSSLIGEFHGLRKENYAIESLREHHSDSNSNIGSGPESNIDIQQARAPVTSNIPQGEDFSGPRQLPSFNPEYGYQY